jgi:hypothetical protein
LEADEGESLSEKRDSEKLIKGGGGARPRFWGLGSLGNRGVACRFVFWGPIDGPKICPSIILFLAGVGSLTLT